MTTQVSSGLLDPPLQRRDGNTLRVILPGRVSDPRPGKQDIRSLADQETLQRRFLKHHTTLPLDVTVVAGNGKGEYLEREEYQHLLELIRSRRYDLVLTEDLGRIVRRTHAFNVCELCEDHDVRLISINNHGVDTAQPGWRDAAFFTAYFYEKENRDKSERIKGRLQAKFLAGGAIPKITYGYTKPPGTKTDDELQKDPDAEPVFREWFRKLDEDEATYAEVSDWLNAQGVPVSEACRTSKHWTGTLVGLMTHNPILKGMRIHNKRRSKRINETGIYVTEKAPPDQLLTRNVPHLAFFNEVYYDHVVAKVDARNAKYRRTGENGQDTRTNVSKKRTRFPGQSVCCGVCGRPYVFGGHGVKNKLMCSGAREYLCWNGITFDGPLACTRICDLVYNEIETMPIFDSEFMSMLDEEIRQLDSRRREELRKLESAERQIERELQQMLAVFRKRADSPTLLCELDRLEKEKSELAFRRREIERRPECTIELPSVEEVKQLARDHFAQLSQTSYEFTRLMRRFVPEIYVFPFRLLDGGDPVLRASIKLTTVPLLASEVEALPGVSERLSKLTTIEFYERPQRSAYLEDVAAILQSNGQQMTERQIAAQLGITQPAVQHTKALIRRMEECGLKDPYTVITEPPDDYPKMCRHKHKRYRFEPLDGFPRPWPTSE